MDKERWQRIESLFERAVELDRAGRDAFLERECAGDDELLAEVKALVAADTTGHSLLDGSAADALDLGPEGSWKGRVIGSYRIVERIGVGGMGAVYLAERADGQFEQRVALKIIKRGMDSDEILLRFHSERQILARLDHPNIARLLDGGVTDEGVPYFTMEYVDGMPIDRYCDEHRLTVSERLELFATACEAVMYAQRNLIVHRDLKPSNIMVTADGTVKLLDFGIAKFLDEADAPDSGITRTGLRVMTPGYAAPEQVRGEPVTTATDVYALGVILYELLTGHRPYRPDGATPQALEKAILEAPPERPSTVVTRDADAAPPGTGSTTTTSRATAEAIGRARGTQPRSLRKVLSGDLDNVCLMALRKEPERRYQSVEQLLLDIRAYRAGRPVVARPDTVRYRAQKFVKRNAAGVGAALGAFVVVAALVTFYTVQLAHERDRARIEAKKAQSVSGFLSSLFEVADPEESKGETITAREILDRGRQRIDKELADQPEVRAQMLDVIARVYLGLGLYDDAADLANRALALRRDLFGENNLDVLESRDLVGDVMSHQSEYDSAERQLLPALDAAKKLAGPRSLIVANISNTLARTLAEQAKFKEAEELYHTAIDIWRREQGPESRSAAVALNDLGLVLHEEGRFEAADSMYQLALETQKRVFGDVHPEIATTLYNYGQLLRAKGDNVGAEEIQREGLAMDRKVFGDEHPDVAYSMNSLAILLERRGAFSEAEKLIRGALAIRRKTMGPDHSNIAYSLSALALVRHEQGHYAEAESLYIESMEMHQRVNGPGHPAIARRLMSLSWLYYDEGEFTRAEEVARRALPINAAALTTDSPQYADNLYYVARAMRGEGRPDSALVYEKRALDLTRRQRGGDHYLVAMNLQLLANIQADRGEMAAAEESARDALAIIVKSPAVGERRLAAARYRLAEILRRAGKTDDAIPLYRGALDLYTKLLPAGHRDIGAAEVGLGRALCAQGDPRAAEPYLRKGVAVYRNWLDEHHPDRVAAEAALQSCTPDR